MFDTDKFIQLIEEHPDVWDMSSKHYMDRNIRDKSWEEIVKGMFATWDEMELQERQQQVKDLKNKWRHIRDNYSKYINQGKSGDPATKRKKYVYADTLAFLQQTFEKRRTSGNIEDDEEEENDKDECSSGENIVNVCCKGKEQNGSEKSYKVGKYAATKKSKSAITDFQKQLLYSLEKHSTEEKDADQAFLLSLLPNVKKLSEEEKLDFRFHTLQFFRDLNQKKKQAHSQGTSSFSYNPLYPNLPSHFLPPQFPASQHYSPLETFPTRQEVPPKYQHNLCNQTSSPHSPPSPSLQQN